MITHITKKIKSIKEFKTRKMVKFMFFARNKYKIKASYINIKDNNKWNFCLKKSRTIRDEKAVERRYKTEGYLIEKTIHKTPLIAIKQRREPR